MSSIQRLKSNYIQFLSQVVPRRLSSQKEVKKNSQSMKASLRLIQDKRERKSQEKESALYKTCTLVPRRNSNYHQTKIQEGLENETIVEKESFETLKMKVKQIELQMHKLSISNKKQSEQTNLGQMSMLKKKSSQSQSNEQILKLKFKESKERTKSTIKKLRLSNTMVLHFQNKAHQFQIIKFIDQGSYGRVSLVRHQQSNLFYSIKTIKREKLNQILLKQLFREIQIQSFVNHPNIVKLYAFTSDAENIYLLLEPCLEQNLFKVLAKKPVKEKEVKGFIKQICSALKYLHQKHILHRDIKPENILLHENTIKICDFGWAIYSPDLRKTYCGTPLYSPPQMLKKELYDNKIDVWSVGILTYELLTGKIPFHIQTLDDLVKIVREEVKFSDEMNISIEAMHFIRNCLKKEPSERYNINEAIQDDFLNRLSLDKYRSTIS